MLKNQSDEYLKETLFQAKRFGLDPNFIQQLEADLNRRFRKNKTIKNG